MTTKTTTKTATETAEGGGGRLGEGDTLGNKHCACLIDGGASSCRFSWLAAGDVGYDGHDGHEGYVGQREK